MQGNENDSARFLDPCVFGAIQAAILAAAQGTHEPVLRDVCNEVRLFIREKEAVRAGRPHRVLCQIRQLSHVRLESRRERSLRSPTE